MPRVAVYPGSFDPITNGHLAILSDALGVFDQVHLLVAVNPAKAKSRTFGYDEALALAERSAREDARLADAVGAGRLVFAKAEGLTVHYCRKVGAGHMIRGLRGMTDFDYEFTLSGTNRRVAPEIVTVALFGPQEFMFVSSSSAKILEQNGEDVSWLLPPAVGSALRAKSRQ